MTTIRQLIQTSPAKANELFAKLVETSGTALKTRERLFVDLKAELELLAKVEEEHLFPALKKHKDTKGLVSAALSHNEQIRKLVADIEETPKESDDFASKVADLRKAFQQSARGDKSEMLPALLKALSDDEVQSLVEKIEADKAEIEEAKRAGAELRRSEAAREREEAAQYTAERRQAAEREQEAAEALRRKTVEAPRQAAESPPQSVQRSEAAPLSTGSVLWDTMFGMWGMPAGRALARSRNVERSTAQEEVIQLAEETLIVGKRTVESGTTTVRRYVVETPVQQQVSLYDERVVVERRKPVTDAVTGETFTELTVEMIETAEVPIAGKSVKVREEVVVRRERTARVETVRDTVRRDEVEIARSEGNERSDRGRPLLAQSRR